MLIEWIFRISEHTAPDRADLKLKLTYFKILISHCKSNEVNKKAVRYTNYKAYYDKLTDKYIVNIWDM